jgi:hypothetical protein
MGSSRCKAAGRVAAHSRGTVDGRAPRLTAFFWGLLAGVVLLAAKIVFVEHSHTGMKLERLCYELLQERLASEAEAVAVVDIAKLQKRCVELTPEDDSEEPAAEDSPERTMPILVTPLDNLKFIIAELVKCKPCAIGVDINFAPYEAADCVFLTPEHGDFHEFCAQQKIPIYFVIADMDPPNGPRDPGLLLQTAFGKSCVYVTAKPHDTRWMPDDEFEVVNLMPDGERKVVGKIPTMAAALAKSYLPTEWRASNWPDWFARRVVDYSALEDIQEKRTVEATDGEPIRLKGRSFFKGKMVLIGCAQPQQPCDTFLVEGYDDVVPGVDLVACTATTLVANAQIGRPLSEPTPRGRLALDATATVILLLIFGFAVLVIPPGTWENLSKPRLRKVCLTIVVLAVLVVGVVGVRYTRLLWSDLIFVIPALYLHSTAEHYLQSAWRRSKEWFCKWITETAKGGES